MKLLVCGFYGHDNFGDDCFNIAFREMLNEHQLKFIDVAIIDQENLQEYDGVVVGGGDLLNDFYGRKYNDVLFNYNGYKIAIGVGVSFKACLNRKYLTVFDDIIVRSTTDVRDLSMMLGSSHVHYMPDLAFSLNIVPPIRKLGDKNIGIFLVGSIMTNNSLLFTILRITNWLASNGYNLHLIPMYSEENVTNTDVDINNYVLSVSRQYSSNIIVHPKYTHEKFIEIVSTLDLAICVRFHSHIYCTILGIPFLSIPLTRKVELYNSELPYNLNNTVNTIRDENNILVAIDVTDTKRKFAKLIENRENIRKDLIYNANYNCSLYQCHKIQNLIINHKKRTSQPLPIVTTDPEAIYLKYRDSFLIRGVNPAIDDPLELLSQQTINTLADSLCYDLTLDTANIYSYGTRVNFVNSLHKLRDMIYYIYTDFKLKYKFPKINLNYIKQDSFQGLHRAGWQYSIGPLYCYSDEHGVFLDTYGDRTFGWARDVLCNAGVLPYTNYWVAFFHHTFDEEFSDNNCTEIFKSNVFRASLKMCKGIYCLTEYLAQLFRIKLKEIGFGDIPVNSLHHPTVFVSHLFDYQKFIDNTDRKLINVGSWYRNPVSIYRLGEKENKLVSYHTLKGKRMESNFCPDSLLVTIKDSKLYSNTNIWARYYIKYINSQCDDYSKQQFDLLMNILSEKSTVDLRSFNSQDLLKDFLDRINIMPGVSNEDFDKLFVENIIFLDLVDASTVNTILEVIVRKTPIVVNRIPPTVELLGESYPLFYDNIDEINDLINLERIKEAHEYMKQLDDNIYRIDHFVESFIQSKIYQNL
jgi:polysaccharide pyruvyl transferase WcaK-like protein